MIRIGLDIGYGQVKVYGRNFSAVFPSTIYPLRDEDYMGERKNIIEVVIEGRREKFLVGAGGKSVDLRRPDFHTSLYARILVLRALREVPAPKAEGVIVATGLPANYSSPERRKELERFLLSIRNGLRIEKVKVIPQGVGAVLDYLITTLPDGKLVVDKKRKEEKIVVVDVGYYTTDVVVYANENIEERLTVETGVSHFLSALRSELQRELRIPISSLSLHETEKIAREGKVKAGGKVEDVKEMVESVKRRWSVQISDALVSVLPSLSTADTILAVGGGAYHLDEASAGVHFTIPPKPELANARGFWKSIEYERR